MPQRALGLNYSTIGYNHVGKVAVINELKQEVETTGGVLDTAIGEAVAADRKARAEKVLADPDPRLPAP